MAATKTIRLLAIAAALLGCIAVAAPSAMAETVQSKNIDFENLPPTASATGFYPLTDQLHNDGVDFEGACLIALPLASLPAAARDGTHAVIPCAANPAARYIAVPTQQIVLHFQPAVHQVQLWVRAGAYPGRQRNVTLAALDANKTALTSTLLPIPGNSADYTQMTISRETDDIGFLVVSSNLPGAAIIVDDLSFDRFVAENTAQPPPTPPPPPPPPPEPPVPPERPPPPPLCVSRDLLSWLKAATEQFATPTCPSSETRNWNWLFRLLIAAGLLGGTVLLIRRLWPANPARLTTRTISNGLAAMTVSLQPDDVRDFDIRYVVKCDARPESEMTQITLSGDGGNDGS